MKKSCFNHIAQDYHLKRKKPWRPLESFINYLNKKKYIFNGVILDLGCGNGRNFKVLGISPKKLVGIDLSLELLKNAFTNLKDINQYSIKESNFIQILHGDISYLPFRPNIADTIFSIAAIHHIKNNSERKKSIMQIYDILRDNGNIILTVWRKWQKKYRFYFFSEWFKRNFIYNYKKQQGVIGLKEFGDKYVPWTLSKDQKTYNRFYHFFSKNELKKLLIGFKINEFQISGGPSNRDNFFIFAEKPVN
ncbi:MAG: class I SAM-dependent methyltransferase [Promethearchaeota archaeon]